MKKCPFCNRDSVALLFKANKNKNAKVAHEFACTNCGFGLHGPIVKCHSCGMIFVDEKIKQSQISTYYEVLEDPLYFKEQKAREKTFKRYLSKLEKVYPRKGQLLDIGTNTGLFVKLAVDSGWHSSGLEPNKWAVDYAKKNYGIKIIAKPFEKGVFKADYFDVITMWDVLEHFTDPVAEMKKVYWYLKSGGVFAFSTVDPDSLFARLMGTHWSWYMEMHRTFLSQKTTEHYLTKIGFSNIRFAPHWRNLSLGYLATRAAAVNPYLSKTSSEIIKMFGLEKKIIPYYANDLFDCYAFKLK